jgi:hypothetical protein
MMIPAENSPRDEASLFSSGCMHRGSSLVSRSPIGNRQDASSPGIIRISWSVSSY